MIRDKLESGHYDAPEKFEADVKLMFKNALRYNQEGSEIYNDAIELDVSNFELDFINVFCFVIWLILILVLETV